MSNQRYQRIDVVKCLAAFAVICIHTCPFSHTTVMQLNGDDIYFIIDTLARFAVPFFFIVSGFFFTKKIMISNDNGVDYFSKYSKKIAGLYLGWGIFYFVFNVSKRLLEAHIHQLDFYSEWIPDFGIIPIIKMLILIIYFGYASPHLWYLIALLWSVGILFFFVKNRLLNILLAASLVLHVIGLFGNSYRGIFYFPITTRNALFFGLFYCALGSWFAYHERWIEDKLSKHQYSLAGYLAWLFCALQLLERYILIRYFHSNMTYDFFIMTIPLSICLFLWALRKQNEGSSPICSKFAQYTLGIYVVHYCLIGILTDLLMAFGLDSKTFLYQLLFSPLVFIISYIVYKYLQIINGFLKLYAEGCLKKRVT